jgi:hypothetical protein
MLCCWINKYLRIRNNDLGLGKILIKCIEWLTDDDKWLNCMFFFYSQRKLQQPTMTMNCNWASYTWGTCITDSKNIQIKHNFFYPWQHITGRVLLYWAQGSANRIPMASTCVPRESSIQSPKSWKLNLLLSVHGLGTHK